MNQNGLEIERKFLIKYPDISVMQNSEGVRILEIEQIYLGQGVRLRKIEEKGNTVYIKTVKEHVTNVTRRETEWQVDEKTYFEGTENIEKGTSPIRKTRYVLPYCGQVFEIDVFPFWNDRAFLEIELTSEDEAFVLPPFITVIKEVTDDRRYNNSSLAKSIITEIL